MNSLSVLQDHTSKMAFTQEKAFCIMWFANAKVNAVVGSVGFIGAEESTHHNICLWLVLCDISS